jgi:1-acyl-sn-glycerol-3-phosphate acyltransferase
MYILGIYIFKIVNQIEIIGKENIPHNSKHILYVSNHLTFIDSLLIGIGLISVWNIFFSQKRIPWNAPDHANFYGNRLGAIFMRLLKNVPVERENNTLINSIIEDFVKVLKNGSLLLFAEGGRTKNKEGEFMDQCKYGVAKTILTMIQDEPLFKVVPICLDPKIRNIMPKEIGQKYFKIKSGVRGNMIIGKSIDFSDIIDLSLSEKEAIELIKKRVRDEITALKP